jgi:F-type H+-transporting ATPase subunit b
MNRFRLISAALVLAAVVLAAPSSSVQATGSVAQAQPEHASPAAASAQPGAAPQDKHATEAHGEETAHDPGWWPTVWKAANFAILVGILTYFLRAPIGAYLTARIGKVREDLLTAAQTRETAVRQLAEIDAKLAALPAELEALKKRGAEDLVAEQARIERDAQAERERLLEQTRREIEMRLRIAKRELLELAAELAVTVASQRIRASITAADQVRLVDRYASQLQAGPDRARGEARQ